jgi:hypothetical protein
MTTDAAGRGMTPMDHDESCAYQRDWPRDLDPECERCRGLLAQKASDHASTCPHGFALPLCHDCQNPTDHARKMTPDE